MVKKIVSLLICIVLIFSLSSCASSSSNEEHATIHEESNNNSDFEIGKTIFECDSFTLTCEAITIQGVEFKCSNKLDENLKIFLGVSLDGTVASLWSNSNETTIAPHETKEFLMHGSLDVTEHELMSVEGTVFADSGNISIDVCDFNLGGKRNQEELPSGDQVYSTNELVVEYIGADAQGVDFKIVNNRKKCITFGADSFTINGDEKDYAMRVTTIPGHSQDIYSIDILTYNDDYFSNELSSFDGILEARIDGEGTVDRFPVSYAKSTAHESLISSDNESVSPVIALGYAEAARLIENEFENFKALISDVSDALEYYNNTDFVSIEDIRTYESMWQDMAANAATIQTNLSQKAPPKEYRDVWDDIVNCITKIAVAFDKGGNLDPNNDGHYTGDEITALLKEIGDVFVTESAEVINLIQELQAISETIDTPNTTTSDATEKYTCAECDKTAPRTYTNPFSGQIEHYCEKHYQEIIEIMSMMEEDVGNTKQSKRTCEQCNREGTHKYESFTGQTEYYCTQHYEKLMEMLDALD